MKIGFRLPNLGPNATPEGILRVSQKAEELRYDSLWTAERLLDLLDTLTYVVGHTKSVGLGTSILDIPYYNPVMLGRRLSTLDVLSGGWLTPRLGTGLVKR